MSLPSELPAAGNFSLKQRVSHEPLLPSGHTSEFYPQRLREKTMFIGCPQITTVGTRCSTINSGEVKIYYMDSSQLFSLIWSEKRGITKLGKEGGGENCD